MNVNKILKYLHIMYYYPVTVPIYFWVTLTPSYWALKRPHKIYVSRSQYYGMLGKTGQIEKLKIRLLYEAYSRLVDLKIMTSWLELYLRMCIPIWERRK